MIKQLKMSRLLRAAVATCALLPLAGCKHVSTWTNVSPSLSTPDADPFGYPPSSDGYLHRPESPLSPVPALPDPGHSVPINPPIPPAPAEADNSDPGESLAAKGKPWALRPMSFLPRKEPRSGAVQSAADTVEKPILRSSPSLGTVKSEPLPVSRFESAAAPARPQSQAKLTAPNAAVPIGRQNLAAPSQRPSDLVDENYTGPVITPGSQYSIGRDVAIQTWPYPQRPAADQGTVKLRKEPQFTADDFVPVAPVQNSNLLPPAASASPAAVPLLLPPGG